MMDGHVNPQEYVKGLTEGTRNLEGDLHLSQCRSCRKEVHKILRARARLRHESVSGTLLGFLSNLFLGTYSILKPAVNRGGDDKPIEGTGTSAEIFYEPLRVLLPRSVRFFQSSPGKYWIIVLLTVTVLLLPVPKELTPEGHRAIGVFVYTSSIMALQPMTLPLAALSVPVVQIFLGIADAKQSFESFARPVVFLILASLFLAEALRKHGLTRRLALKVIVASGGDVKRLLLGIMAIASLLSMWVYNTATAAVLIPVALTISRQVQDTEKARQLLVLLVLGIAYAASLGGMVTIIGASSNAVASGLLAEVIPWSFFDWIKYGFPAFLLLFPVTYWVLFRIAPLQTRHIDVSEVQETIRSMGPMSAGAREVLVTMCVAALMWIFGSRLEILFELPPSMLSSAVVAVVAVLYLGVRSLITWEDLKGVSWGLFFVIGAGLSLGDTLTRTGATDWFAIALSPIITGPPLIVTMLLLVTLSALLTNLLNNTTIAAVFVPVLISVAQTNPEFTALQLVLPVTLATTFGYSLPSASTRMALISASGIVDSSDMFKYGMIVTMVSSIILALLFYVLTVFGLV